jgi:hypothetical protein
VRSHARKSRSPVARLDRLIPGSVAEIPLDHMFIEIGELTTAACDPTQQATDQVEVPARAVANQADFDETRCVDLDERTVGSMLETPEQSAPAQIFCCNHRPDLRC